jgi:chloramphenicol O-acetyltransferase
MDKEDVRYLCIINVVYIRVRVCIYVYITNYYSVMKKNETAPFAAKLMDLDYHVK